MSLRSVAVTTALSAFCLAVLTSCSDADANSASADPSSSLSVQPSPSPSSAEPILEPGVPVVTENGVTLWPQYGDFVLEGNKAVQPVESLRIEGRDADADYLTRISATPQARWVGDWMDHRRLQDNVRNIASAAVKQDRIGVVVVAALPGRECEVTDADAALATYTEFARQMVEPLAELDGEVWFVVEPGAVSNWGECENAGAQAGEGDRVAMLNALLEHIDRAGGQAFIDVGSARGPEAAVIVERLTRLNLDHLAGLTLGTGTYETAAAEQARGDQIVEALAAAGVPNMRYIVDTSRGGRGTAGEETCNAADQAIGLAPRLVDEGNLLAYTWLKRPGESDGICRVKLTAGQFSLELALELAKNGNPEEA